MNVPKPTVLPTRPTPSKTGTNTKGALSGAASCHPNNSRTPASTSEAEVEKRKAEIEARLAQLRGEGLSTTSSATSHLSPSSVVVKKTVPPLLPFFVSLEAFTLVLPSDGEGENNFMFAIGDSLTVTKDTKMIEGAAKKQLGFLSALERVSIPSNSVFMVTPDSNSDSPRAINTHLQSPKEQFEMVERYLGCDRTRKVYAGEQGKVLQIFTNLATPAAENTSTLVNSNSTSITLPDGVLLQFIDGAKKYFNLECIVEYIEASVGGLNPSRGSSAARTTASKSVTAGLSVVEQRIKEIEEKEKRRKMVEVKYEHSVKELMSQPSLRGSWGTGARGNSTPRKSEAPVIPAHVMQWNVPPPPPVITKAAIMYKAVAGKSEDPYSSPSMGNSEVGDDNHAPSPNPPLQKDIQRIETPSPSVSPEKGVPNSHTNDAKGKSPSSKTSLSSTKPPTAAPSEVPTKKKREPSKDPSPTSPATKKTGKQNSRVREQPSSAAGQPYVPLHGSSAPTKDGKASKVPATAPKGYVQRFPHRTTAK